MRGRRFIWIALGIVICAFFPLEAGRLLVINHPERADAILILAGETDHRPARGLELFEQGYAAKVILDVPAKEKIYHWTTPEIAERWISTLPEADAISVCRIYGRSTKAEALEAAACAERLGIRTVLLVTSDYHTRRALSTFKRELPGMAFSIAAAYDSIEFGTQWWRHREWAKTTLYEWMRLGWWVLIDRWF